LIARLDPLQELATIFAGEIGQKQGAVTAFIDDVKAKLEQPVSGPMVEELMIQKAHLDEAIRACKESHQKLRQGTQQMMQQTQ